MKKIYEIENTFLEEVTYMFNNEEMEEYLKSISNEMLSVTIVRERELTEEEYKVAIGDGDLE